MKIIYAGTTDFGIPTLERLKNNYELVLIITQPDKPTGRNKALTPPPIKVWAEKNNIPVQQPDKIASLKSVLTNLEPDLMIVAAYGQIIPKDILDIPKFKSINIHGSLLPKYRGPSPIQTAILNGSGSSGITLIQMDEKMDHGPIITTAAIPLDENENYTTLHKKMSLAAADLVMKILPDWFAGKITPVEQAHSLASYTKLLTRDDARIVWTNSGLNILEQINALNPEPGTWTTLDGKNIKVISAKLLNESKIELPGKIYSYQGQLAVKTKDISILIDQIQPEGKSPMSGKDFLNGLKTGSKIFI